MPMNQRKIVASIERSGKTARVIASKTNEKTTQNPIVRKNLLWSIAVMRTYEPANNKGRGQQKCCRVSSHGKNNEGKYPLLPGYLFKKI